MNIADAIKVLLVEDEWIVSEELKELLNEEGFSVVGQADNSHSALELLGHYKPDVALIDLNLKRTLEGISLARNIERISDTRVILFSSYTEAQVLDMVKELEHPRFTPKPFVIADVCRSIYKALA